MPRRGKSSARATARATTLHLIELPTDVLSLVLYHVPLAHDIALAGLTCRGLHNAVKLTFKARPFSGEVVTLAGHEDAVACVAVAPDGRIITGSDDTSVKLWRGGECVRTIEVHTDMVSAVAVLPGGARFFSGALDETAKLWTIDGELDRSFELGSIAHEPGMCIVHCLAVLPDGVHFVVGLDGDGVTGFDVRLYHVDGTLVHTFEGHEDWVCAVAVTHDGQYIISGAADYRVKAWSVASKSLVSTCAGHRGEVLAVAAMPDGQRILSGSVEHTVRVWLLDGTPENTFSELHTAWVRALVALPDNQHALSASDDRTVKLFNVNDGVVLRTFKHHGARNARVLSLALLPDGLRFVSGSNDETACIVYHGLACAPEAGWLEAEAAARASRKKELLAASAKMRGELSALEAAVESAVGGVEVDARLSALETKLKFGEAG
jgi:WD40 repeat protein